MARINSTIVYRLKVAVLKLASVGPFQERLKEALDEVRAFPITDFPPEVADRVRAVDEFRLEGGMLEDAANEEGFRLADLIVDLSHELSGLYAKSYWKERALSLEESVGEWGTKDKWGETIQGTPEDTTDRRWARARILLHVYSGEDSGPTSGYCNLARVPSIGEYVHIERDSSICKVQLVLYTPFRLDIDAEVSAIPADLRDEPLRWQAQAIRKEGK